MMRGEAVYYSHDEDDARPERGPRSPDDFMGTGTIQGPRRRGPRARTPEERRRRRYLYWLGLVRSGMTYREIEAESGFGVATIHAGVRWASRHGEAWLRAQIQEGRSAG
jgi:hypothetical protein